MQYKNQRVRVCCLSSMNYPWQNEMEAFRLGGSIMMILLMQIKVSISWLMKIVFSLCFAHWLCVFS